MIARSFALVLLTLVLLALSTATAQPAASAVTVPAFASTASFDLDAATQTRTILNALMRGDRTPLLAATPAALADRAEADFDQYLVALADRLGPLEHFRILGAEVTPSGATTVRAAVAGAHGTDVMRLVWRQGYLVTLNRGRASAAQGLATR